MLEILKNKIWDILKKKDVSLVIIYDSSGEIYWHRGREIVGKDVFNGVGFCKSLIKDSIVRKESIQHENVLLSYSGDNLSTTAISLSVKSLLIIPLGGDLFLYLDSGSRDRFDKSELDAFTLLGELMRELIGHIRNQEIDGEGLTGDKSAVGIKIDYPNDLFDWYLIYRRIGDGFDPSLGFVPRNNINVYRTKLSYMNAPLVEHNNWGFSKLSVAGGLNRTKENLWQRKKAMMNLGWILLSKPVTQSGVVLECDCCECQP